MELAEVPRCASDWRASLLRCVEQGAQWPEDLRLARGAWLRKESVHTADPAKYSGLLVLAGVYRVWVRQRLRGAREWADSWASDVLFAGQRGF
eukprot:3152971-Alexandrium_andersonii.AAC.1